MVLRGAPTGIEPDRVIGALPGTRGARSHLNGRLPYHRAECVLRARRVRPQCSGIRFRTLQLADGDCRSGESCSTVV